MRTTVEMKAEHRSALLALSAKRGEKGFSSVLGEAIDVYLRGEEKRQQRQETLLAAEGVLSEEDANHFRRHTIALRENWR